MSCQPSYLPTFSLSCPSPSYFPIFSFLFSLSYSLFSFLYPCVPCAICPELFAFNLFPNSCRLLPDDSLFTIHCSLFTLSYFLFSLSYFLFPFPLSSVVCPPPALLNAARGSPPKEDLTGVVHRPSSSSF